MRASIYEDLQTYIQDSIVLRIRENWFPGVMEQHSGITLEQKPEEITQKKQQSRRKAEAEASFQRVIKEMGG